MTQINKVVITAGGTGSRLLPFTKETPKEMLPVYSIENKNQIVLKPILQVIFESLYNYRFRNFCFIVGRGKRIIEDHFLSSSTTINSLNSKFLDNFFKKLEMSNISFVQQPKPLGFGDAVLKSKYYVGHENFLLHAGDDIITSKNSEHLKRLETAFTKNDADLAFLVTKISNPKQYGVIEYTKKLNGVYTVKDLEEKPKKPKTNLAVIATYMFKPRIFKELENTLPDKNGEVQLATAVKKIIQEGNSVAVELHPNEKRLDVGNPYSYYDCISQSFKMSNKSLIK